MRGQLWLANAGSFPCAGLGAYAYNVENDVLGSRGLDLSTCESPRTRATPSQPPLFCTSAVGQRALSCKTHFHEVVSLTAVPVTYHFLLRIPAVHT